MNLTVEATVPLALSDVGGLSAAEIGLVLLPAALLTAAWGPFAGRLVDRGGVARATRAGAAATVAALFALSAYGVGGPVWLVGALVAVVNCGAVLARIATTKAVSLVVPEGYVPSGVAINEMVWMLGVGLGTALFAATLGLRAGSGGTLNPLHSGAGAPHSDAFLALAIPPLAVLLASSGLGDAEEGS